MLFLFIVFIFCAKTVTSKYEQGFIDTSEKWKFITRFCFLSEEGQFEYSIQYEKTYATQNLLLYYDSDAQWPAIYKSAKTCEQREAVLSRRLNQIIPLKEDDYGSGCQNRRITNVSSSAVSHIVCHQARRFHSSRERWWFLAISNCNSTKGLKLHYRFLMTNGPPGDYWHEHFSADEFYILPLLVGFCVIYMLMVLSVIMCSMELKSRQLYHSTYKLFAISVYLQELGIFLEILAYIRYASDGIGIPRLLYFGKFIEAASEVVFLVLLLLLAKGYTVTRGRLRLASSVKLTIFVCVYVVTYASLFIYEKLFFDPGEVLYTYESPAGYGLVGLRIAAWWAFIYSIAFTLKHFPEKSSFYHPFSLVGTLWFISSPTFILAANTLIDKWVRESVVCAVQHFTSLAGHILFLVLTVPNRANKNFPYHVRTTQIGVMELTNGISGNSTLDNFGHHPYAPGGPILRTEGRVPLELFTITSTVHTVGTIVHPEEISAFQYDQEMDNPSHTTPPQILPPPSTSTSPARIEHRPESSSKIRS